MVKLSELFGECRDRRMARAVPAQIVCRVLGAAGRPCAIDAICRFLERRGLGWFYGGVALATLLLAGAIWWALRGLRLAGAVAWVGRVILPPCRWLVGAILGLISWFDEFADDE